ncbi:MAG: hypothetical protein AAF530_23675 [Pseudomonadota bacterium]
MAGQFKESLLEDDPGHAAVLAKLKELYGELFCHEGFGELRVEMRILRRGQKEVVIHCGKQYRFVIDVNHPSTEKVPSA